MDFSRFHIVLNKDNTYEIKNYLPFIVKGNGTWSVDDPQFPFHLIFREDGADETVETEIGFLTVDGERQLTIKLSPGCQRLWEREPETSSCIPPDLSLSLPGPDFHDLVSPPLVPGMGKRELTEGSP